MIKLYLFLLCLAYLLLGSGFAYACDFDDDDGLDVALVLSGGGAKASTQVGVMQIMDELGIPIHCITGTSMGAAVGSFYAAGYSADEIGDILTENDWGRTFRGATSRKDKSFVEKEREETYFSGNVAGINKDGLILPGSINSMQGLKTLYRNILSNIELSSDFNKLGIPFRAIATDLKTGHAKVFESGDLVESILASMAVPGVFAPREIDGSIYVDGGLATNLPIKAAMDMGADIIIALDVTLDPGTPEVGMSIAATAQQITTIFIHRSVQEEIARLGDDDVLIRPNTIDITTAAYTRSAEGIVAGRSVGEAYTEKFLQIKAIAAPSKRQRLPNLVLNSDEDVRFVNLSGISDQLIAQRYAKGQNQPEVGAAKVRRLRDLASFGGFGEVDLGHQNGDAVLTIKRNPLGRNLLQVGVNATNDFSGSSTYGILTRLTRKPLSKWGGDVSVSAEFGTNLGLSAELYQPISPDGRFFIQPELYLRWDRQSLNIFDERFADFWSRRYGARGRIGREIGMWGVIAFEGELEKVTSKLIVSKNENFKGFTAKTASLGAYFAADTLNRTDWPTYGHRLRLRAKRSYDLDNPLIQTDSFEASWLSAFKLADFGFLLNARYGDLSQKNLGAGLNDLFLLGGFRQLGGFTDSSVLLTEYSYGSLEVFRRLNQTGKIFELPIYVGAIAELAVMPLELFEIKNDVTAYSGSVYIGTETPIGPLFIGSAYGNNDQFQLFFKFGKTF